ncbi:NUDIX hydrolase [Corynebacterium sp. SCR221107]|uniref:NUDIX domain-containing protein n=1 Tax=Corynebacterium sp. SCR221107 TaxID=3017361 RepID=UPI0022EC91CE|nr:NUDIX hydrolase [Corynebacterium sp. SCR221107]WBT08457.1 NUDIX hydrolase [Corynebacterium sp. SCR221107]
MSGIESLHSASHGEGWAAGPGGTRMWGRHGAAGLALVARAGDSWTILMQHRAAWTSHGDTWALPGGAREASEDARQAAGREVAEETEIYPDSYEVLGQAVTAGPFPADPDRPELAGQWTYTTVFARAPHQLETHPNEESHELRWVALDEVAQLKLMPAFAASWPKVKQLLLDYLN